MCIRDSPLPAPEDRVLAVSELQDVLVHQEADAVLDLPLTQGGQGSIGPLPLQPVTADLLVLPAAQHCGDQSGAEPLAGLRHTAEDGPGVLPHIDLLEIVEAVVAGAAVVRGRLAEIVQDILTQAPPGAAVERRCV